MRWCLRLQQMLEQTRRNLGGSILPVADRQHLYTESGQALRRHDNGRSRPSRPLPSRQQAKTFGLDREFLGKCGRPHVARESIPLKESLGL